MTALDALPQEVHFLPDSRYQEDEGYPSSLLAITCHEQQGRLHTLLLLQKYLSGKRQGRKHQLVAQEQRSLRHLYEAVWGELGLAFPQTIVDSARVLLETSLEADCANPRQYALF